MDAYLIFDLKLAYRLIKENNFLHSKKKLLITDKIVIFNLLKSNNLKNIICLDNEVSDLKRKEIFLKEYSFFDKKLKTFGNKNYFFFKKIKINSIYNTFKFDVPRYYAGVKILVFALNKIIKKKRITKMTYFGDLSNNTFSNSFYAQIFSFFCKKKKIEFDLRKNTKIENNIFYNQFIKIYYFLSLVREITFSKIIYKIKKKFSKVFFKKSSKNVLFISPQADLKYVNTNNINIFNYNIDESSNYEKYKDIENKLKKNIASNIDEIFLNYIKEKNIVLKPYFIQTIQDILNILKRKNIKEIFWGISPTLLIRNALVYLKKKTLISGLQHGGKYFIMQDDMCHKDSDYSFCDKFYAYGLTSSFNKKKFSKDTKIINSGCFKNTFYNNIIIRNKNLNQNTILYVPVSLSNFTCPVIEARPTTRFILQKKICSKLEKFKDFKTFVKIIPFSYYNKNLFDKEHIETNPIYLELNNYKSLKINSKPLIFAYENLKPRIVITDYLSTPIYELSNSPSEIILFLDRYNYPKKDVLKILKKRFFIVENVNQMERAIKLIKQKKQAKNNNKLFYKEFYKEKEVIS
tara:strand:- start:20255 stop:21982 length:1728 start_codon:yes stop_codon:yes gene_type:complete